jgi:hypothetical protein
MARNLFEKFPCFYRKIHIFFKNKILIKIKNYFHFKKQNTIAKGKVEVSFSSMQIVILIF